MKSQDVRNKQTVPLKKIGEVNDLPLVEQKEVLGTPDVKQGEAFPNTSQSITETREGGKTQLALRQEQKKTTGKGRRQKLLKVPTYQLTRNQKGPFRDVRGVAELGVEILQSKINQDE